MVLHIVPQDILLTQLAERAGIKPVPVIDTDDGDDAEGTGSRGGAGDEGQQA